MTEKMRKDFEAWHNKRAEGLLAKIEVTTAEFIADGFQDSPGTKQAALFHVLARVDETGWEVWQAALAQAASPCFCDANNSGEPGVSCGDCPKDYYKQADVGDSPPKLFAVSIAQRKWNFLQAAGYKMQKIHFEQGGASGTIDAWGKVVWQTNVIAREETK